MSRRSTRAATCLALVASLAVPSGSCSRSSSTPSVQAMTSRGLPASVDKTMPKGHGTQDFLIYLDIQVLNQKDDGASIYDQVLRRAEVGAQTAVPLKEEFQFRSTSSVSAVARDT